MELVPCFKCGCFLPMVVEAKNAFNECSRNTGMGILEFDLSCWDCEFEFPTVFCHNKEEVLMQWNNFNSKENSGLHNSIS